MQEIIKCQYTFLPFENAAGERLSGTGIQLRKPHPLLIAQWDLSCRRLKYLVDRRAKEQFFAKIFLLFYLLFVIVRFRQNFTLLLSWKDNSVRLSGGENDRRCCWHWAW